MITEVHDIGCQHTSDQSRDQYGWELILQCLDSQHRTHAEDTRALKSVLMQLNECCDVLKREIQDDKMLLRFELHKFREDFRSFCLQQASRPTCIHGAKNVAESFIPDYGELPDSTSAKLNSRDSPPDFTFHHAPQSKIIDSEIFMVCGPPPHEFS